MTESERFKLHIWSLDESRDGPAMAELRHMIAGMVHPNTYGAYYAGLAVQSTQHYPCTGSFGGTLGGTLGGTFYCGQRWWSD